MSLLASIGMKETKTRWRMESKMEDEDEDEHQETIVIVVVVMVVDTVVVAVVILVGEVETKEIIPIYEGHSTIVANYAILCVITDLLEVDQQEMDQEVVETIHMQLISLGLRTKLCAVICRIVKHAITHFLMEQRSSSVACATAGGLNRAGHTDDNAVESGNLAGDVGNKAEGEAVGEVVEADNIAPSESSAGGGDFTRLRVTCLL